MKRIEGAFDVVLYAPHTPTMRWPYSISFIFLFGIVVFRALKIVKWAPENTWKSRRKKLAICCIETLNNVSRLTKGPARIRTCLQIWIVTSREVWLGVNLKSGLRYDRSFFFRCLVLLERWLSTRSGVIFFFRKLLKTIKNDRKWPKMTENGQKSLKIIKTATWNSMIRSAFRSEDAEIRICSRVKPLYLFARYSDPRSFNLD